jgi:hypothetical protein
MGKYNMKASEREPKFHPLDSRQLYLQIPWWFDHHNFSTGGISKFIRGEDGLHSFLVSSKKIDQEITSGTYPREHNLCASITKIGHQKR